MNLSGDIPFESAQLNAPAAGPIVNSAYLAPMNPCQTQHQNPVLENNQIHHPRLNPRPHAQHDIHNQVQTNVPRSQIQSYHANQFRSLGTANGAYHAPITQFVTGSPHDMRIFPAPAVQLATGSQHGNFQATAAADPSTGLLHGNFQVPVTQLRTGSPHCMFPVPTIQFPRASPYSHLGVAAGYCLQSSAPHPIVTRSPQPLLTNDNVHFVGPHAPHLPAFDGRTHCQVGNRHEATRSVPTPPQPCLPQQQHIPVGANAIGIHPFYSSVATPPTAISRHFNAPGWYSAQPDIITNVSLPDLAMPNLNLAPTPNFSQGQPPARAAVNPHAVLTTHSYLTPVSHANQFCTSLARPHLCPAPNVQHDVRAKRRTPNESNVQNFWHEHPTAEQHQCVSPTQDRAVLPRLGNIENNAGNGSGAMKGPKTEHCDTTKRDVPAAENGTKDAVTENGETPKLTCITPRYDSPVQNTHKIHHKVEPPAEQNDHNPANEETQADKSAVQEGHAVLHTPFVPHRQTFYETKAKHGARNDLACDENQARDVPPLPRVDETPSPIPEGKDDFASDNPLGGQTHFDSVTSIGNSPIIRKHKLTNAIRIATGGCSQIYYVQHKDTGESYVMKNMLMDSTPDRTRTLMEHSVRNEMEAAKKVSGGPFVAKVCVWSILNIY